MTLSTSTEHDVSLALWGNVHNYLRTYSMQKRTCHSDGKGITAARGWVCSMKSYHADMYPVAYDMSPGTPTGAIHTSE